VVRACEALGEMLARNRSLTFLSLEDNQVCVGCVAHKGMQIAEGRGF
jgi:hypothetical protein